MKGYYSYDKANDDQLKKLRLEKFKVRKYQQEIFQKLVGIGFDFTSINAKEHIFKGVPSKHRSSVWIQLSRNPHGITKEYYNILLKKGAKLDPKLIQVENKSSSVGLIKNDVNRTFSDLKIFSDNQQLSNTLEQLLSAWVAFRPDIGYIQGMSSLAGFLLTELQDFESFTVFTSLLTSPTLHAYYSMDIAEIQSFQKQYQSALKSEDPKLFQYLKSMNVEDRLYVLQWIMTLFTRCLQFQSAARVWNIILYEEVSRDVLIRVCCGLVRMERETIFDLQREQIIKHLKGLKINYIKEDLLLQFIWKG